MQQTQEGFDVGPQPGETTTTAPSFVDRLKKMRPIHFFVVGLIIAVFVLGYLQFDYQAGKKDGGLATTPTATSTATSTEPLTLESLDRRVKQNTANIQVVVDFLNQAIEAGKKAQAEAPKK